MIMCSQPGCQTTAGCACDRISLPKAAPVLHPVQTANRHRPGQLSSAVTLKAYEVYCELYGKQEAMVTGGCRGGFSTGELIAFLYARSFPKAEWRARFDEAVRGSKDL